MLLRNGNIGVGSRYSVKVLLSRSITAKLMIVVWGRGATLESQALEIRKGNSEKCTALEIIRCEAGGGVVRNLRLTWEARLEYRTVRWPDRGARGSGFD